MPSPKRNESEEKYMSRCMEMVIGEGKKPDQAAAMCHSMYAEAKKSEERGDFPTEEDLKYRAKVTVSHMTKEEIAEIASKYAPETGDLKEPLHGGDEDLSVDPATRHGAIAGHYEEVPPAKPAARQDEGMFTVPTVPGFFSTPEKKEPKKPETGPKRQYGEMEDEIKLEQP